MTKINKILRNASICAFILGVGAITIPTTANAQHIAKPTTPVAQRSVKQVYKPRYHKPAIRKITYVHPNTAHTNPNVARRNNRGYWFRRARLYANKYYYEYYPDVNWNFRSLGGLPAGHGYHTRHDKVFRGTDLAHITKRGIRQMRRLNINKIIDLRCYHQQGGKDPYIRGIRYIRYPMVTARQKAQNQPGRNRYGEIYDYGAPFVTTKQVRKSYRFLFTQLLHERHGAIYYHCIAGRDRTGTATILLLSALGVHKWTIFNDFMDTNFNNPKHSYPYEVRQIEYFYYTIRRNYGNMNNYLHRGVGLSNQNIRQLKHMYLVK